MTTEKIIEQLNPIFKNILDNEDIVVTVNTTAGDIEEWDSLTHIQLVVAIEKHFKVHFKSNEITNFKNVGDMCEAISSKLSAA